MGVAVAATEVSLGLGSESGGGPVSTLLAVVLLLPNVSVSVRRLHDVSRSGWWLLIALVPLAGLVVLLVFFLSRSTPGWNAHGPDPRVPLDEQGPPPTHDPGHERLPDPGAFPGAATTGAPPAGPTPTEPVTGPAGTTPTGGTADVAEGAAWVPPGWDLPSAAEPGAGRPRQDPSSADDETGRERPGG